MIKGAVKNIYVQKLTGAFDALNTLKNVQINNKVNSKSKNAESDKFPLKSLTDFIYLSLHPSFQLIAFRVFSMSENERYGSKRNR